MFGPLGTPEIIIIGVVIILIFGVGKLSGLGRDLGSSIKEFRRAVKEEDPPEEPQQQVSAAQTAPPPQPPASQTAPPPAPPTTTGSGDQGKTNIF